MTKLYYQTLGNGPDMVLLHGWGLHSYIWHLLVTELQQHFRLHLIDLPGCGKSKEFESYPTTINELADCIVEKTPKNAVWVGWSLGGLLASYVAIYFPERVKQLITITATPKFIADEQEQWPGLASQSIQQFANDLTHHYEQTLVRFLSLQWHGIPNAKVWLKKLEPFFLAEKPDLEALQHQLKILQTTDLRLDWKKIQCPALHILGRLDAIVPMRLHEKLKQLVPHHEIHVMSKAAHLPFLTHQDEFLTIFYSFLKTNL